MNNRTRLARLREFQRLLKSLQKKRISFDISSWCAPSTKLREWLYDHEATAKLPEANVCGTVACALGAACLHRPFREKGLVLNENRYPQYHNPKTQAVSNEFHAGMEFFGLSYDEAVWLFSGNNYYCNNDDVTPAMVAQRVDKLIKHHVKSEYHMSKNSLHSDDGIPSDLIDRYNESTSRW